MKSKKLIVVPALFLMFTGCTEKAIRLVIDPPVQGESARNQKITVENVDQTTGKQERISIPVPQMPSRVVVDQPAARNNEAIPSPTLADAKFTTDKDEYEPNTSYLKGVESVDKLYRKKKFHDALIQLAPLIDDYPSQPKLYVMQGTIYRKLGETKLAQASYQKALELDKDNLKIQQAIDTLQSQAGSR